MNILADLARVKAIFQQRTVVAIVSQPDPVMEMADRAIAKRAAESRRSEAVATSYRAIHSILKEGLRKRTT